MDLWNWFASVALQGIAGAATGGVVAWLLLRRTILHEARGDRARELQAFRDRLASTLDRAWSVPLRGVLPERPTPELLDLVGKLRVDLAVGWLDARRLGLAEQPGTRQLEALSERARGFSRNPRLKSDWVRVLINDTADALIEALDASERWR